VDVTDLVKLCCTLRNVTQKTLKASSPLSGKFTAQNARGVCITVNYNMSVA
jgi:hypothetical protein